MRFAGFLREITTLASRLLSLRLSDRSVRERTLAPTVTGLAPCGGSLFWINVVRNDLCCLDKGDGGTYERAAIKESARGEEKTESQESVSGPEKTRSARKTGPPFFNPLGITGGGHALRPVYR